VLKKSELEKGVKLFDIPVVGSASCGPAEMFADQNVVGHVTVSQKILQGRSNADGVFAVQAVGDSLNEAKNIPGGSVDNGDLLIVDSNIKDPDNGSYVLSVIEGCANAKRFYKDDDNQVIKFVSESKLNMPDIVMHADDLRASDYMINGKIIRVLKD
jgi:SOS-response transcriptional repressor LexA